MIPHDEAASIRDFEGFTSKDIQLGRLMAMFVDESDGTGNHFEGFEIKEVDEGQLETLFEDILDDSFEGFPASEKDDEKHEGPKHPEEDGTSQEYFLRALGIISVAEKVAIETRKRKREQSVAYRLRSNRRKIG